MEAEISGIDHQMTEEQPSDYNKQGDQRSKRKGYTSGRGVKRRGGDRSSRSKRWRGSGGSEELPFLRGGNINDPLNLESVKPEEDVGEGLKPLEVIIPKNPRDPLNLKKIIKNRNKRKRRNSKMFAEDVAMTATEAASSHRHSSFSDDKPAFDPIVSPVPASVVRKFNYKQAAQKQKVAETSEIQGKDSVEEEKKKLDDIAMKDTDSLKSPEKIEQDELVVSERKTKMNERFRYGNFDRYYGCRIERSGKDPRVVAFKKEWFEKKSVLDIGCNAGYITLWIAKEFGPRRILGIDIDAHLVGVARKNIRHYCDNNVQIQGSFPASFAHRYGPVSAPPIFSSTKFPDNVWFRQENYVLECDEYLDAVKEEFDVILALSITKWIHLNWGDEGIVRFFKRIFLQLRPGGKLILEPQEFKSYYKRAKMTAETMETYKTLKFLPESFQEFLLNEVGFESFENVDVPKAKTKGFDRPIQIYTKKLCFNLRKDDESLNLKIEESVGKKIPEKLDERVQSPKRPKHIKFED